MTIDEAIQHCKEVAKENRKTALEYARAYAWDTAHGCRECANEHEQLAAWLVELKKSRECTRWIPCSERLPENRERVLVCFRSGTVHIAVWYGDYDEKGAWKVTSQFPTKLYRTGTIPKWMPMPELPEVFKQ